MTKPGSEPIKNTDEKDQVKPDLKVATTQETGDKKDCCDDTCCPEDAATDKPQEKNDDALKITALEAEVTDLKDRLLRSIADMENLRRRTEKEKQDTAKFSISKFARDVLIVGDNIQRALASVDASHSNDPALVGFMEGVQMIDRELNNVLERHGVTALNPEGKPFDPNFHQAMYETPKDDVENGIIIEVIQTGYRIGDRVLRPAMVGVAKNKNKTNEKNS